MASMSFIFKCNQTIWFLTCYKHVSKKLPREHIQELLKHQQHQKDKVYINGAEQKLKEQAI